MMMNTRVKGARMGIPTQARIEGLEGPEDVAESTTIIDLPRNIVCNLPSNL